MTTTEILETIGSRWTKGNHDRIYINDIARWIGLEYTTYKSGMISSATLDGEHISNNQANTLARDLRMSKLWYDVPTDTWHSQWEHGNTDAELAQALDAIRGYIAEQLNGADDPASDNQDDLDHVTIETATTEQLKDIIEDATEAGVYAHMTREYSEFLHNRECAAKAELAKRGVSYRAAFVGVE